MISEEMRYKLLRLLEAKPGISQRDVARELSISLGRVNYCLQALIRKGWVKARHFKNSRNKSAYLYLLTPPGIDAKARLTVQFLRLKLREYEMLRAEIDEIRREARRGSPG